MPPDYKGTPFDDAAYRAQQETEASLPQQPRRNYAEALVVWDSKTPAVGNGWVGHEQPAASIRLDEADNDGKKVIHYHNQLNGYRYAIFGWQWAKPEDKPVDLAKYDALSFSIKTRGKPTSVRMPPATTGISGRMKESISPTRRISPISTTSIASLRPPTCSTSAGPRMGNGATTPWMSRKRAITR